MRQRGTQDAGLRTKRVRGMDDVFFDIMMIVVMYAVFIAAVNLLCAALCKRLAEDKGYPGKKWFRWGVLFGLLAVIEIIHKPNLNRAVSQKEKNTIDVLREYKQLLDSGAITPEEFERLKARLLNK